MKYLVKILAVLGAIAAIGAVLYVLRDKLKALCPCCCGKDDFVPMTEEDPFEDEPMVIPAEPGEGEVEETEAVEAETEETPAEEVVSAEAATAEDFVD
ncbi:MAG: hypothetical protein E7459_08560 [Ruminococcaceae bacterium]|nr:hypothetical protein [Oscillospiraceae bacterium]